MALGRRYLTGGLAVALAVALVGAVTVTLSVGSSRPAAAGSPPACPVGQTDGQGGCTVSLPCLAQYLGCDPAHPPTVDVRQVADIQDGQYVTVKTTNFPTSFTDGTTTGSMRVALCSTTTDPTNPLCLNGQWEASLQAYTPVLEQVSTLSADHSTQVAVPIFYDASGESSAMPAQLVNPPHVPPTNPGIFCDNGPDPCAVEVTVVENTTPNVPGTGDTTTNTVVMPLSYLGPVTGCPATDAQLNSESSYSVEHFLAGAVAASCAGANGVIDINTPTDTTSVAGDFSAGNTDLGFVDDPADPSQEALEIGGRKFAFVPVAVSATTVGFLADQQFGNSLLPIGTYRLTPTMVAGLVTSQYFDPTGSYSDRTLSKKGVYYSDNLLAGLATATTGKVSTPLDCSQLVVCAVPPGVTKKPSKTDLVAYSEKANAFDLLNPVAPGVVAPTQFASYMTDAPSGAAYQATSWICRQPNAPMTLDLQEVGVSGTTPVTVTDTTPASSELTGYPYGSLIWNGDTSRPWIYPTCDPYSSLPSMVGIQSSNPQYAQYQLPTAQAHQIRNYVYGGGAVPQQGNPPYAAFGIMDSSQAAFLGVNQASVQNAVGNFESPSATTVDAALASAQPCPSGSLACPLGTYRFDYAASYASDAYPMPDVTYAMVPTSPLPAAQAEAMKNLLTGLVEYGHGTGAAPLAPGYYPLPDAMYQSALSAIGSDVTSEPTTPTTTTTTTATAATGSSGGTTTDAGVTPADQVGTASYAGSVGGTTSVSSAGLPFSPTSGSASTGGSTASGPGTGSGSGSGSGSAPSGSGGVSTEPPATLLVSLVGASRFLLPASVALALACLVAGTLLLVGPETRRRRREVEQS